VIEDDLGVASSRWEFQARVETIAAVRRAVTAFARQHGMRPAGRDDLGVAVSEAVAHAVSDDALPASASVVVDVATDGAWMSVRLTADAAARHRTPPPLMAALADRVEWGAGHGGHGTVALLEFPMTARAAQRARLRGGPTRNTRRRRASWDPGRCDLPPATAAHPHQGPRARRLRG
jgi:hypothetical protein